MKKAIWRIFLVVHLMIVPIFISGIFADPPGPPAPGGNPGSTPGGVPVGAPIDDGIFILLALGMAYGCYQIYKFWRKRVAEKNTPVCTFTN